MSARPRSAGSYARAIEHVLERVRGGPALLSPRDFRFVSDWHARGVPLALIVESIEAAAAPRRGRSKAPRKVTLAYVAPSVEEAWGVVLGGRTVEPAHPRAQAPAPGDLRERWLDAAQRAGEESALGLLVREGLRRIEDGGDAATIDLAVDEALAGAAPPDVLRAVEARVDADLLAFASRMIPSGLVATRRRAIVDRLRRALDLPRLGGGRG